jgi:hypothetical protein
MTEVAGGSSTQTPATTTGTASANAKRHARRATTILVGAADTDDSPSANQVHELRLLLLTHKLPLRSLFDHSNGVCERLKGGCRDITINLSCGHGHRC